MFCGKMTKKGADKSVCSEESVHIVALFDFSQALSFGHIVVHDRGFRFNFFRNVFFIRFDHILINFCISGKNLYVSESRQEEDERRGKRDGEENSSKGEDKDRFQNQSNRNSAQRNEIALDAEKGKDHGVLDNLEERKVEGNHLHVDIEAHAEECNEDKDVCPQKEGCKEGGRIEKHGIDIERKNDADRRIEDSHRNGLLIVAFYGVQEIRPNKNGLASCNIAKYVCATNVNDTEGE